MQNTLFFDPRTTPTVPSVTEMNKNFVIKYRLTGEPDNGRFNKLIGAGKYSKMFGTEYRDKHFVRAFESVDSKFVVAIRGKYIISFMSK